MRLQILDLRPPVAAMAKMRADPRELSVHLEKIPRFDSLPPPASKQNLAASETYLANVRVHRRLLMPSRIGVFFFLVVLQALDMDLHQQMLQKYSTKLT